MLAITESISVLYNKMGTCLPSILDGLLVVGLAPPGRLLHVHHEEGVAPGGRGKTQFILTLITVERLFNVRWQSYLSRLPKY
jgi:hypothetical protein